MSPHHGVTRGDPVRPSGSRPDVGPPATGSLRATMTQCPQCASPQVDHLWRTDMARLTLIDRWTCLDSQCGHRWDTTMTYEQLQPAEPAGSSPADGVPAAHPVDAAVAADPE
jgi:hypothetical protein